MSNNNINNYNKIDNNKYNINSNKYNINPNDYYLYNNDNNNNYNISEPKSSRNYTETYSNLPSNIINFEDEDDDKFCLCFYTYDILMKIETNKILFIVILCLFQILFTGLLICLTLDLEKIFHIIISIQSIYAIFCLFSLFKKKCIRYFCCVFIIIFSLISVIFIFVELGYYIEKNRDNIKANDFRIFVIMARGLILFLLVYCMLNIFCKTFCDEHRNERGGLSFRC